MSELDLTELRNRCLTAGEQHRARFDTSIPGQRTIEGCVLGCPSWPCEKAFDYEPEIDGDDVIALLDRIETAEAALRRSNNYLAQAIRDTDYREGGLSPWWAEVNAYLAAQRAVTPEKETTT